MERVVRNNTRKSSLFKIQAQKNKFEDHFTDFGCCRLLENHPECAKYEDYLKELTEVFIRYSFEVGEGSPFFQGMNYNGRYCGFHNGSHSFSYRDWLPHAKQVFLEGPCNKPNPQRFELTNKGKGFFELTVEEHFETFSDGDTVRLLVTDESGKQFSCVPPSARRVVHDAPTNSLFGVYSRTDKTTAEDSSVPSTALLAMTMDIRKIPLEKWAQLLPRLVKCNFNTVIIKGLFDFNDASVKVPLLNSFSLKLTSQEVGTLQDIIEKLKEEQIKVLFKVEFYHEPYQIQNSLEAGYLLPEGPFQFNLKQPEVIPFLLASLTYLMQHFKIDGFKFGAIDRVLLRGQCLEKYSQPFSYSDTFIEDCSRESILFTKLINMIVERNNSNFISYCGSNCMVPGAAIPLVEGGFGFLFSSQEGTKHVHGYGRHNLANKSPDRPLQLYFNCIEVSSSMATAEEELDVIIDFLWSASGVVCTNSDILTTDSSMYPSNKFSQLLHALLNFREQGEYFMQNPMTSKEYLHGAQVVSFHRNKYVFLINLSTERQTAQLRHSQPAQIVYCSKPSQTENVNVRFENGSLYVAVPAHTAVVLEKERIN